VSAQEMAPYRNPLDVLRRGVPTPYNAEVRIAEVSVSVESNDPAVLATLGRTATSVVESSESKFCWRIVRDDEAPGTIEPPVTIRSGALTVSTMSAAVIVAVDSDRRELLAFIGPSVDARAFEEIAFPLFRSMMLDAFGMDADSGAVRNASAILERHEDA
jgi:hypothetical protein